MVHIIESTVCTGTNIHGALKTAMLAATASFTNTTSNTTSPRPEPIIIFLTDGDPTIGITDPNKILSMVKVRASSYMVSQKCVVCNAEPDSTNKTKSKMSCSFFYIDLV